jgi:radical SAM superfamily enzyme
MLTTYRKPFRVVDVFQAHRRAREADINTAHYFLFGGPGESEKTVTESLDNIEELERAALFFFTGVRIYPRTKLHQIAVSRGRIAADRKMLQPVFYHPAAIDLCDIEAMVIRRAAGRMNWIVGSGGEKSAGIVAKMHERGHSGPLWELLAR